MTMRIALLILSSLLATSAGAVCLDPRDPTLTTYFHPTLEQELSSSAVVVVGKVVHAKALSEDSTDPDGWTAFIYTIEVVETLKGQAASRFEVRVENNSGGYRMADGETHLMLLSKRGESFGLSPCGNSVELPGGSEVLERAREILRDLSHVG